MKVSGPVLVAIAVAAAAAVGTVAVVAWTGAPHEHTEPEGPCPKIHLAREDVGNTTVYTVDEIRNGSYLVEDLQFSLQPSGGNWSAYPEYWHDRFKHLYPVGNTSSKAWVDYTDRASPTAETNVGDSLTLNRSGLGLRLDVWDHPARQSTIRSIGGTWDCGDQPEGWHRDRAPRP